MYHHWSLVHDTYPWEMRIQLIWWKGRWAQLDPVVYDHHRPRRRDTRRSGAGTQWMQPSEADIGVWIASWYHHHGNEMSGGCFRRVDEGGGWMVGWWRNQYYTSWMEESLMNVSSLCSNPSFLEKYTEINKTVVNGANTPMSSTINSFHVSTVDCINV